MFISCFKYEKNDQFMLELRQYSDLSRHIKEPQNSIYGLNFLKMINFESRDLVSYQKYICSILSVLSVSLLCDVFVTASEHEV